MREIIRTLAGGVLLALALPGLAADKAPSFAGTWVPLTALAQDWSINALPLTTAARQAIEAFNPARLDSSNFCMPFGTPRNTLNTAPDPFEILVTDGQITFIFDSLGDVRRIYMDGRDFPEDPIPNWMGYSIGNWQGDTLQVTTIAMTSESILNDVGLPHSESLRVSEQFSLVMGENGSSLLRDDITLTDPESFTAPISTTRYFQRAPYSILSEGSSLCLLDMWRDRLEDTNREMFRELQAQEAQP